MKETIVFAADHGGLDLKTLLLAEAAALGFAVLDLGTDSAERTDFPLYAAKAVEAIKAGQASRGVLVCGTGIGMSMAANRHKGIRAAVVHDVTTARLCREHNDANILCLGGRIVGGEVAKDCLKAFLETGFAGGRYEKRRAMLD